MEESDQSKLVAPIDEIQGVDIPGWIEMSRMRIRL